jgi:hypothetical protein
MVKLTDQPYRLRWRPDLTSWRPRRQHYVNVRQVPLCDSGQTARWRCLSPITRAAWVMPWPVTRSRRPRTGPGDGTVFF